MRIHKLLNIRLDHKQIIAICGAGGKTTLMYALAREASAVNKRVAVMTTTHIKIPCDKDLAVIKTFAPIVYHQAWAHDKIVVAGRAIEADRLCMPSAKMMSFLRKNADMIYVEADGAKRLPLKYPATWEPVIPEKTDQVIVVTGLSALNQPLDTICHRAALVRKTLRIAGDIVDEQLMAKLIIFGYGRYRPTVFLNQADDHMLAGRGERIAELLRMADIDTIAVASLYRLTGIIK
jgi:probable selenium-dependent hydroxylase accessory protein YqeC